MEHEIRLPELGQTVSEATIEKWHKQAGDQVAVGDVLMEVSTDKATLEVEADVEGQLDRVLHPEGSTAAVGEVIAVIRIA